MGFHIKDVTTDWKLCKTSTICIITITAYFLVMLFVYYVVFQMIAFLYLVRPLFVSRLSICLFSVCLLIFRCCTLEFGLLKKIIFETIHR